LNFCCILFDMLQ